MESLFQYDFMIRAMIAGGVIGMLCGVIGVFVVLRGLAFLGDGVGHAALTGIALSLLLGLNPLVGALLFCILFSFSIPYISKAGRIREDTAIGILFSSSLALGVFLLNLLREQRIDLMSYLFGNILFVGMVDLWLIVGISVCIFLFIWFFYKEFLSVVFDESFAALSGIPAKKISYLLLALMAISIVVSIKMVGIILVASLIITPAASALQFVRDFDKAVILSAVFGVVSTELGIVLSFYVNTAPGATIVLTSAVLFLFSLVFKRRVMTHAWF